MARMVIAILILFGGVAQSANAGPELGSAVQFDRSYHVWSPRPEERPPILRFYRLPPRPLPAAALGLRLSFPDTSQVAEAGLAPLDDALAAFFPHGAPLPKGEGAAPALKPRTPESAPSERSNRSARLPTDLLALEDPTRQ
ncbi:MAG: hypothetical protein JKY65_20430 [Planctomycetes bacterium]|nr:hypothetical protein [Planctomycetota bacterium]